MMYFLHFSITLFISSGRSESKNISLPVRGWMKPSDLAWRAWRGNDLKTIFYKLPVLRKGGAFNDPVTAVNFIIKHRDV